MPADSSTSTPPFFPPGYRVAVLLPLPLAGAYDYLAGDLTLAPGDFVAVPLGHREVIGVVWGAGAGAVPEARLRRVDRRLAARPLPEVTRAFIDWVAAYTLAPAGAVLKMAMSVPAALEPAHGLTAVRRAPAPPTVKDTPARRKVLDAVGRLPPLGVADLAREAGVGATVVRGLIAAGALETLELPRPPPFQMPDIGMAAAVLSPDQRAAADALLAAVDNGFSVLLIDGVTGSGKTEVYFEAVAAALAAGRQVLVLLPEIALSTQWLERFKRRFGVRPAEWHSDLGDARRRETWRAVADGGARVIVGARSALFLPYPDLGLIVVDEEHDGAFKQEDGVSYHARDMAVVRARLGGFPVVLASATPSLETMANVQGGRYRLLHLPDRHAGAVMPEMNAVDLRRHPPPRGRWLSPVLVRALEETFAAGEQAMLYLNRRGYAPLTLCRTCGHRLQCPHCTAWLVEHRHGRQGLPNGNGSAGSPEQARETGAGRLICHHCGYHIRLPKKCPHCEAEDSFTACGPGVERVAEEALALFPHIRMAVMTSDTCAGPHAAAEFVRQVAAHEIDLLVGTQIVAKGYHFPMLTVVGVVDADLGLEGGDLRAG
ncbi:MAG: primosomal protein N', partial [Magnetospirillum sp.]